MTDKATTIDGYTPSIGDVLWAPVTEGYRNAVGGVVGHGIRPHIVEALHPDDPPEYWRARYCGKSRLFPARYFLHDIMVQEAYFEPEAAHA